MRLNKIKNLFVVLTLGLSTHSCLDLEPQEQLAETNYWNTPDDYLLFANQFYGWTRHFSGAMEYKSTKPVHSDYTILPQISSRYINTGIAYGFSLRKHICRKRVA